MAPSTAIHHIASLRQQSNESCDKRKTGPEACFHPSDWKLPLTTAAVSREAVAAVDRLVAAGLEGNLARSSAVAAGGIVHLPDVSAVLLHLACLTALGAPCGLVLKSALCEEFLLSCRENEILAAISAIQYPVFVNH